MPIVEKESTEAELRATIERLDSVMGRNPSMVKNLAVRKAAVQRELNLLLLSLPGYAVYHCDSVEAVSQMVRQQGYDAGYAQAGEDLTK